MKVLARRRSEAKGPAQRGRRAAHLSRTLQSVELFNIRKVSSRLPSMPCRQRLRKSGGKRDSEKSRAKKSADSPQRLVEVLECPSPIK